MSPHYRRALHEIQHTNLHRCSEADIARQLFPDQGTFVREENRGWKFTTNHWDLPIHVVKADAAD
jgi:hypothetical protein